VRCAFGMTSKRDSVGSSALAGPAPKNVGAF
jgi:hypothetical protein